LIEFLRLEALKLDAEVGILAFSVASGTTGVLSVVVVFLNNSENFIAPDDVSLKFVLKELKEIEPVE
jgi:hypothetical protein